MAKLSAAQRNAMSSSTFCDPKNRKFPINDKSHARAALRFIRHADSKTAACVRRRAKAMGVGTKSKSKSKRPNLRRT